MPAAESSPGGGIVGGAWGFLNTDGKTDKRKSQLAERVLE